MPVEVTAGVMADTAGMLLKDIPRPATLRVDTLVSVLAVDVVTIRRGPHADTRAMQAEHIIGMAAVTGAAGTGAAVTGTAVTGVGTHIGAGATLTRTRTTAIILTGTILRTGTSMTTAPYQDGVIFTPDPSVILFRRVTAL